MIWIHNPDAVGANQRCLMLVRQERYLFLHFFTYRSHFGKSGREHNDSFGIFLFKKAFYNRDTQVGRNSQDGQIDLWQFRYIPEGLHPLNVFVLWVYSIEASFKRSVFHVIKCFSAGFFDVLRSTDHGNAFRVYQLERYHI